MSFTVEEILRAALQLPPEARVRLAHKLLLSLSEADSGATDAEWAAVITRRSQEVASGRVKTYDARWAIEEIRARLRVGRGG